MKPNLIYHYVYVYICVTKLFPNLPVRKQRLQVLIIYDLQQHDLPFIF